MSAKDKTRERASALNIKELISKWDAIQSSEDLLSSMFHHQRELQHFLTTCEIDEKFVPLLVRKLKLGSQASERRQEFERVLGILCESSFLTHHVTVYATTVCDAIGWQECQDVIKDITDILTTILNLLPQFSFKVMVAASQLNLVVNRLDTLPDRKRLLNSLAFILHEAKSRNGSSEKVGYRRNDLFQYKDTDTPPDNFLNISVVPTSYELLDKKAPFLRRAVLNGPYKDVEHYLDVQFRLMKSDFMIPLKNGLKKLSNEKDLKGFRCSEIRLYHNVRFMRTSFKSGFNHVLQFDISKCKRIDWESADRLMDGALVCLSKDSFKTIIVAIVARRRVEDLQVGKVEVNVKDGLEILLQCTERDHFLMAESEIYYNPYFHVLEGLKAVKEHFPFRNVLILCNPEIKPPAYILSNSREFQIPYYDLSCLMHEEKETIVPVLTTVKWPEASAMCLNDFQRDAAILALTKEVCVIQGPPGTGKTYVGLKVVETLLKNKTDGNKGENSTPILIVCYTNHALDQFLEGITKFCPRDIVRIGGGCKTECLQKFNLNLLRRKEHTQISNDKKHIEKEIYRLHCKVRSLRAKIHSADILQQFMVEGHYESLNSTPSQLSSWLNAPSGATEDEIQKQIDLILKKLVLQWKYTWSGEIQLDEEMNILDRCAIYCTLIKKVRKRLNTEMHFARRDGNLLVENEMKRLINLSYSDILPDDIFDKYFRASFSSYVCETFSQRRPVGKNIIEYWILGKHRQSRGQLQDIEELSRHLKDVSSAMASGNADVHFSSERGADEDPCFEPVVSADFDSWDTLYLIQQVDKLKLDELEQSITRSSSEDGWQNVDYNPVFGFTKVIRILLSTKPMTEKEENNVTDIWKLSIKQRYALYMLWLRRYEDHLIDKLKLALEELNSELRLEKDAEDEQTATLLKQRQIIGMTTTGAAKYKSLLEKVGCSVVVVEEAAEVLESHVITALNENCQHLILIGDHQQLRPKPATYELEINFGLDVSLFERLIKNNIPHVTLKIQHRMRPEVSQIIKLIYPGLEDHPSVCEYDYIRGVSKDVFFINHNHQETRSSDNFSKSNLYEAEFAVALCQYLLKQDYKPTQVTILATYKGQVTLIKKKLAELNCRIRVSAVDDFQGEENEIIILSLVRNNDEDTAGFVKIDNRVCVALSRAKKGFFVLGNFDFLASKSKLWRNIIDTAKKNEIIGPGLPVCCINHPESVKYLSTAKEFSTRPEGGCGSPCMFLLKCGHLCQLRCHGYDASHEKYVCKQACRKNCQDGHPCSLMCNEVCQCQVLVTKTLDKCGHQEQFPCCVSPKKVNCLGKCLKTLSCGHLCQRMCKKCVRDGAHEECTEKVQYTFQPCGHEGLVPCCKSKTQVLCEVMCTKKLNCGHLQQIPCHQSPEEAKCSEKCPTTLSCGHPCTGQCGECIESKQHKDCRVNVDYTYQPCGHSGQESCCLTKEEARCPKECSIKLSCGHHCSGKCSECLVNNKHNDCLAGVDYTHQACGNVSKVPCYKSSTYNHCTGPCTSTLKCGHPCSGKCSECLVNNKHEDCLVEVDYTQPSCGHVSKVPCYKTSTHIVCTEPCTSTLKCGHQCKGTCSDCLHGLVHQACNEYCHLLLPCGHPCQGYCSTPCLPCKLPCPFKCRHKSCTTKDVKKTCGEPCTPCRRKCMQKCAHLLNLKYCSENWDNESCSKLCTKKLKSYIPGRDGQGRKLCLHPCKSICGEMCVCAHCEKINCIEKKDAASETKGPVLKLPLCKHTFHVSELDKYVKGHNQSESSFIYCPLCNKPILNCLRYDTINQQRFYLRERKKRELIQRNKISSELKDKLERSRNVLREIEDFKPFDKENDRPANFSSQSKFISECIRLKFIFAVIKLSVDLKAGQQSDLIRVLVKTTRISQQLEIEMNQEITRRLSLNVLNFLEKIISEQTLKNYFPKMNEIKDELNKAPTNAEVLESAREIISFLIIEEEYASLKQLLHTQPLKQHPLPQQSVPEQFLPQQPVPEQTLPEQSLPEQTLPQQPLPEQPLPQLNDFCHFKDTYMKILQVLNSRTDETLVDVLYPDVVPTCNISETASQPSTHRQDRLRDRCETVAKKNQPKTQIQHRKSSSNWSRKVPSEYVKKEETKASSMDRQTKASSVDRQTKSSSVNRKTKASYDDTQTKDSYVERQTKASYDDTQTWDSYVDIQTKASYNDKQTKDSYVDIQTWDSYVDRQTKASYDDTQTKASSVYRKTKASYDDTRTWDSFVDRQTKASYMDRQTKASYMDRQTKASCMNRQTKASYVDTKTIPRTRSTWGSTDATKESAKHFPRNFACLRAAQSYCSPRTSNKEPAESDLEEELA